MASERISAIGPVRPPRPVGVDRAPPPAAGPPRPARPGGPAGDAMSASTGATSVKLAGLAGLSATGRELRSGDVLVVQVVATTPELEFALFDPATRLTGGAGARLEDEHAAMRFDQLALLRQVAGRLPSGEALGTAWRGMVLETVERQAASAPPQRSSAAAADRWPSDPAARAVPPPSKPPADAAASWLLGAFAWAVPRLTLRVLAASSDDARAPRRPRVVLALQFDLLLGDLGRISAQLALATGGVVLDLAAERGDALASLRAAAPAISSAVARAGLRLTRCRLQVGLPAVMSLCGPAAGARLLPGIAPDKALPPELFRAAAEVALALVGPLPAPDAALLSLPCR